MPIFSYKTHEIPYRIRTHKNKKGVRYRVDARGLQVTIPYGYVLAEREIDNFLEKEIDWLLETLERLQAPKRDFAEEGSFLYLGEEHNIAFVLKPGRKVVNIIGMKDNLLWVEISRDTIGNKMQKAMKIWYRQEAYRYLKQRVDELARAYGLTYNTLTVREFKSQWGRCSNLKNLTLNWRLILAIPPAIDYVITHELCHLLEMNHGPYFWGLVKCYYPNYKYGEEWLIKNSPMLQFTF